MVVGEEVDSSVDVVTDRLIVEALEAKPLHRIILIHTTGRAHTGMEVTGKVPLHLILPPHVHHTIYLKATAATAEVFGDHRIMLV